MIRFSKKIEYALGALQYLGTHPNDSFSAREISEQLDIPYEFLSKTMQQLARFGLVNSNQGVKGGYRLTNPPENIKFTDILKALDEDAGIVTCFAEDDETCKRSSICLIKSPMSLIQSRIDEIIASTTLADIIYGVPFNNNFDNNVLQKMS